MIADDKHKSVIRERKKRERNNRIQSILEAAKKVFFSKGYAGATMDEIALEAEISKPTIYQYFKTKDDLYFSLMLPVVDELRQHLEKLEMKLIEGGGRSGADLLRDLFRGCYRAYESAPDTFRIIQQFQQTGLIGKLHPDLSATLAQKGARNFHTARRIMELGVKQGLLKKVNAYEMVDVFWSLFVGIIQLQDIKSQKKGGNRYLRPTLKLAEKILVDAMAMSDHAK